MIMGLRRIRAHPGGSSVGSSFGVLGAIMIMGRLD